MFEIVISKDIIAAKILKYAALSPEDVVALMTVSQVFNQGLKSQPYWKWMVENMFPDNYRQIFNDPDLIWFEEYKRIMGLHYSAGRKRTSAIFSAIRTNDVNALKVLSLSPSELYKKDKQYCSVIRAIVKRRYQPMMDYIFNDFIRPLFEDSYRNLRFLQLDSHEHLTPVQHAVRLNQVDFMRALPPAVVALSFNHHYAAEYSENGTYRMMKPLHLAASQGYLEMIEILLACGADVNDETSAITPFQSAVQNGQIQAMEYLRKNGAIIHTMSQPTAKTLVYHAIMGGQAEAFTYLQGLGMTVASSEFKHVGSVLHGAVLGGSNVLVDQFIDKVPKEKLNVRNDRGETPLHLAASMGKHFICKRLIDAGADVTAVSGDGNTVLHFAVKSSNIRLIKYILEVTQPYNAIHATNNEGRTPLYFATSERDCSMLAQYAQSAIAFFGNSGKPDEKRILDNANTSSPKKQKIRK